MKTDVNLLKDEFQWLEEEYDAQALLWVNEQNKITQDAFTTKVEFELFRKKILTGLNSPLQIPGITKFGKYFYNIWLDENNPRGLLRRTTLEEYCKTDTHWEIVLDIGALGEKEGKNWIYQSIRPLKPDFRRALIFLSPDGGDATEMREFDFETLEFVTDGFFLPVAKSRVEWVDYDHLFVSTYFDEDSLTDSGYPRIVKMWKRHTPLSDASVIYSGQKTDMMSVANRHSFNGLNHDYIVRVMDFHHRELLLMGDDHHLSKIAVPEDAKFRLWREWGLIQLTSKWEVNGESWPSGSLLAINFQNFMSGKCEINPLFVPKINNQLNYYSCLKDYIIISITCDVVNHLELLMHKNGNWSSEPFVKLHELSSISAWGVDENTNEYFLSVNSFLQPASLSLGDLDNNEAAELLKYDPSLFNSSDFKVNQNFVLSLDGTRVPYFIICRKDIVYDGKNPTLLYGYGGFEISFYPEYLDAGEIAWLENGGVFVLANIRGGGEYGPQWHKAALKENRMRAYEDFAAVAQDVIDREITSPAHLAAQGGSNGGLLVGNMLTLYPELFGAIVCEVPLLDMLRYTDISAGASWIAEYGNPKNSDEWDFIRFISPYHNLNPEKKYPAVLFSTATSDDRVGPGHARKMAAKMQALGIPHVYFYENTEGGHSAAADKGQSAFKHALFCEFLLHFIGRNS